MASKSFAEVQDALFESYIEKIEGATSDKEVGEIYKEFVLARERLRHGVTAPGPVRDIVDQQTMATLASPEILGPEHSFFEGFFRRLAKEPTKAWLYQRADAEQRSQAQSRRAQKARPSRQDSITRLIAEILEENPSLTAKEVGRRLAQHPDVLLLDGEYRHNSDAATMTETALKDRVSKSKKRLSR